MQEKNKRKKEELIIHTSKSRSTLLLLRVSVFLLNVLDCSLLLDLQLIAGGKRAGSSGLPRVHRLHVVLRSSGQHHHLPLRIPPSFPAFS